MTRFVLEFQKWKCWAN